MAEVGTDVKVTFVETGYNVSAWVDAVVPGTAFNSYVIAGLEKDPNFGDNIHQVIATNTTVAFGIVLHSVFLLILQKN